MDNCMFVHVCYYHPGAVNIVLNPRSQDLGFKHPSHCAESLNNSLFLVHVCYYYYYYRGAVIEALKMIKGWGSNLILLSP